MRCKILFLGKSKKNITNLSSAELAERVVKVKSKRIVRLGYQNFTDFCMFQYKDSFIHSFIHLFIHQFNYLFIYLFIYGKPLSVQKTRIIVVLNQEFLGKLHYTFKSISINGVTP